MNKMIDHSQHHDHTNHHSHTETESTPIEYAKFGLVILAIFVISYFTSSSWTEFNLSNYLRHFMGTFFLVFALFKLLDLKGFVSSYIGYDIIAKRSTAYAYVYPFVELGLALGYFLSIPFTVWLTLIVMVIGSIGVIKELMRGSKIKCACLGTYIKLPLTTVSLVEDVGMGIMALLMVLKVI